MINRYGPCVGITLFKFGRRKIELWRCPAGYTIPKHSHELEDIELAFVKGEARFFRCKLTRSGRARPGNPPVFIENLITQNRVVTGFNWKLWKTFSIPAGTVHWFSVSTKPLWFINFSKWKCGVKVTSASTDFKLTA